MNYLFVNLGKHYGGAENYLVSAIIGCTEHGDMAYALVKNGSPFEEKLLSILPDSQVCSVNYTVKDINKAKEFINKNHIQVQSINGINSGAFINLLNINIPRITVVHSNAEIDRADKPWFVRKAFICLENYSLKKSNSIIVVSEAIKELLISRGIDTNKINVIHNGVKEIKYTENKVQTTDKLKICFVGRLEKVKGCEYLIKALGIIAKGSYVCDIIGDGTIKEELKKLCVELGIDDKVNFKGFVPTIRDYLYEYDVMVLPSLSEAFPLTIPEAMNAKVLLICSRVGGIPYIIDDGVTGYLFESENYEQLARKIQYVIQNPEERYKIVENAYELFSSKYTLDAMLSKTFELMGKMI